MWAWSAPNLYISSCLVGHFWQANPGHFSFVPKANRVIEVVRRLRELSPLYEMVKEGIDLKSMHWATE